MANLSITINFDSYESDLLRDYHEDVTDLSDLYKTQIVATMELFADKRAESWRKKNDTPGKLAKDFFKSAGYKNAKDRKS